MSIRNLMRMKDSLYLPAPGTLVEMLREGYNTCLAFLKRRGLDECSSGPCSMVASWRSLVPVALHDLVPKQPEALNTNTKPSSEVGGFGPDCLISIDGSTAATLQQDIADENGKWSRVSMFVIQPDAEDFSDVYLDSVGCQRLCGDLLRDSTSSKMSTRIASATFTMGMKVGNLRTCVEQRCHRLGDPCTQTPCRSLSLKRAALLLVLSVPCNLPYSVHVAATIRDCWRVANLPRTVTVQYRNDEDRGGFPTYRKQYSMFQCCHASICTCGQYLGVLEAGRKLS